MNREPVLFRVDGTRQSGWERYYRCLVYAAALQRRRRPAFFLSQLEPQSLALPLKRVGNDWLSADDPAGTEDDLTETLQEIRRVRPTAVVVDAADVSDHYLAELAHSGIMVVSIDHTARGRLPSRLVINPLLGPAPDAYDLMPGAQILAGPRYAIVRPEIRRVRPLRAQEPVQPFRAMVALGDEVPPEKVIEVARRLLPITRLGRVDVVVRAQHLNHDGFQTLASENPNRLELATEPAEVSGRLARSHLAVTTGDSWSLELACVGVPQIVLPQSDNHWPTARRLEDEGAAICVSGSDESLASALGQAVEDILDDPHERQAMARCGRKLIDGRGPDRLVTALEILLHPSRTIDVRAAA